MSPFNSPTSSELCDTILHVTSTMLDAPVQQMTLHGATTSAGQWTGCVTISGPFSGGVMVTCPRYFAESMARTFLDEPADKPVSPELAREALAEMTNVVGGNLKALFSPAGSACRLSLPTVSSERGNTQGGKVIFEEWFDCLGVPVCVTVYASRAANESTVLQECTS